MIRIGVIGCGHWGPNHLRVFSSLPGSRVLMAADTDPARRQAMSEAFPNVQIEAHYEPLLAATQIDAIVIATPVSTHFEIARNALESGKDVLCEKPLTVTAEQCQCLIEIAERRGRVLMVGDVYLFNNGVRRVREHVQSGGLGQLLYGDSVRTNRGPIRTDVSVVRDLASHDVSMFNYLLNSTPVSVNAHGMSYLQAGIHDVAFITLVYPQKVLIQIQVSWLAAKKVRQVRLIGSDKSLEWDELATTAPIALVEKKSLTEMYYKSFGEFQLLTRENALHSEGVAPSEPLEAEARHFLQCVRDRTTPLCDGRWALGVVKVLAEIEDKLTAAARPAQHSG